MQRAINNHHNNVSGIGGFGDLLLNGGFKFIGGVFETGGIYQPKLVVFVLYLAKNTIARCAGFACDNRLLRSHHTIKERTLADVRLANNCNGWKFACHIFA